MVKGFIRLFHHQLIHPSFLKAFGVTFEGVRGVWVSVQRCMGVWNPKTLRQKLPGYEITTLQQPPLRWAGCFRDSSAFAAWDSTMRMKSSTVVAIVSSLSRKSSFSYTTWTRKRVKKTKATPVGVCADDLPHASQKSQTLSHSPTLPKWTSAGKGTSNELYGRNSMPLYSVLSEYSNSSTLRCAPGASVTVFSHCICSSFSTPSSALSCSPTSLA